MKNDSNIRRFNAVFKILEIGVHLCKSVAQCIRQPQLASVTFSLFCCLFWQTTSLNAQTPASLDSLLIAGKQQLYNLELQAAEQSFHTLATQYPDYPHGKISQAYFSVLIYTMDRSNEELQNRFQAEVEAAVDAAELYRDRFPELAEAHFYLGMAYGIKSIYHITNLQYLKTYWFGRKARKHLDKAIDLDPEYHDAELGLGVFHYYADLLPGMIRFVAGILGFEGDRKKGIAEIMRSADGGHSLKFEAQLSYHTIRYFLEGDTIHSITAFKQLHAQYPQNSGLALMLAYHYRESGQPQRCIDISRNLPENHSNTLPLLTNLKYYNLATANYDLNQFEVADSFFNLLTDLPTRKSKNYLAAVAYYKGLLADYKEDRPTAMMYYREIEDDSQTRFWYNASRMPMQYPTDSLMQRYILARNLKVQRRYMESRQAATAIHRSLFNGTPSTNPDLRFLVIALLGENAYHLEEYQLAKRLYQQIHPDLDDMKDRFRCAWIYLNYGRCLSKLGDKEAAAKMFDKAHKMEDDYTRLVIEKERFLLN